MTLWRCRECGHDNDFDAEERELNGQLAAAGEVLMLTRYECSECGFGVKVEPFWFLTAVDDRPVFIETGFQAVSA